MDPTEGVTADQTPTPGSDEARQQGCKCPVIDNAHGLGAQGTRGDDAVFWRNGDCPMHGFTITETSDV